MIIGADSIDGLITSSAETCCSHCHANPRCIAFTYAVKEKTCYLKDNVASNSSAADRTSGTNGRPPPGPPGWSDACTQPGLKDFKFCDRSVPLSERVDDLVMRIQLNETGPLLTARQSIAIPRLGIPSYYWGTNAIHGLQNLNCLPHGKCPTSFPAPCALSAAFNDTAVHTMGKVLAVELRAYYNSRNHNSLDTWSPTINVNRDPRWGRNVESPGEDPLVCGRYGAAYTQGLQEGPDPNYVQTVVTLKHWLAYSLENYGGQTRHTYNAIVSPYDLASTYLIAWREAVQTGGALGVMCSYNLLNGKPTCGDPNITAILRGTFGFEGYITSDSDAVADIWETHHYEPNAPLAVRDALVGGCDIDSGNTYINNIPKAVDQGLVDFKYAQDALRNSFRMRFRLGLFDGDAPSPYKNISTDVVGSDENLKHSLDATRQGIVLLKNLDGLLPMKRGLRIALIGVSSDSGEDLLGNYVGPICPSGKFECVPSLYDKLKELNAPGDVTVVSDPTKVNDAIQAAQLADFVVLVASNAHDGGGEGQDRTTISLAANQMTLLQAVLKVGKPSALVLINGGIIAIDELADSAPAIIEAFMPGIFGAQVIAETLFGINNPGGKMPVTMYQSNYINQVDFLNMSMTNGVGRSYRYFTGIPLFPFGYGLSYTIFRLDWTPQPPPLSRIHSGAGSIKYTVNVSNIGDFAGDEVVLAFFKPSGVDASQVGAPVAMKQLFDYQRVHLAPGQSIVLTFTLSVSTLALADAHGHRQLFPGSYSVEFSRGHGDVLESSIVADIPSPILVERFPMA